MKPHRLKKFVVPILIIAIIVLGFKATSLQNKIQQNNIENAQIEILLTGKNKAAGFTCGVLGPERAKSILGSENVIRDFGQGPTNEVKQGEPNPNNIFWADSCRYQDSTNSTKYVELLISTFQSNELAKNAFLDFIPEVNNKVNIQPGNYGQELIYDSGVYYLLQNNRVIQIAASNGNPSEAENFSRQVFDSIIPQL